MPSSTAPSTPLDFQGRTGTTTSDVITQDAAGTSVGLGRATGGGLGVYNICIGLHAGQTNTGANNVAIGVDSVSKNGPVNNTVVLGYGAGKNVAFDSNTFIGTRSGENVQYGSLNSALGYMSMKDSVNGWFNTALGSNSMQNIANGNQNVAVGSGAMQNSKNSNENTVCGYLAAFGTESSGVFGDANCVFGSKAAYHAESVHNSVAVGAMSAFSNRTGDGNVTLGHQAGFSNVSSSGIVAVGSKAGYSALVGKSVYVGESAGESVTSGAGNVCVGHRSGSSNRSGSENAFLGIDSGSNVGSMNLAAGALSLHGASASKCVAMGYESGKFSVGEGNVFVGDGAGKNSTASECIYIGGGMGHGETVPLSLAIGSSCSASRPPLITGNLDTSDNGKPGITCKGRIRVKQNSSLGSDFLDNGVIMYRNDSNVKAVWHMYVDDNGNYVFGKNGTTAAVLESDASIADIPSLDFTGQHRCKPTPSLMAMVRSGMTCVGLPIEGNVVVSAGSVCTAIGKLGEVYSDKRGVSVSQALPLVDLSYNRRDKAVFGVVSGLESCTLDGSARTYNAGSIMSVFPKEPGDDRLVINSIGEGAVWVSNYMYAKVENGDYVTTSAIPGVTMKQRSSCLKNSTVAKLTVGFDFDMNTRLFECKEIVFMDKRYVCALLPCTFHCG